MGMYIVLGGDLYQMRLECAISILVGIAANPVEPLNL